MVARDIYAPAIQFAMIRPRDILSRTRSTFRPKWSILYRRRTAIACNVLRAERWLRDCPVLGGISRPGSIAAAVAKETLRINVECPGLSHQGGPVRPSGERGRFAQTRRGVSPAG